jgi:hypothetical protein
MTPYVCLEVGLSRLRTLALTALGLLCAAAHGEAQSPTVLPQMPKGMAMPQAPLAISDSREGSGTSWLPDESPMAGPMRHTKSWMLMLHGSGFLQFVDVTGDRSSHQLGSVNWLMGMARRTVAGGALTARGMFSAEALTVGRCGYPDLAQSGEFCRGAALHDRQHPHDLFMEVAADYRHALSDTVALELYGGPAGEPALGPTAYPHRLSAMPNPIAPISHHWLDSSHISFGVVTVGLYGRTWKAEGSGFNGREPDDQRYDVDFAPLDSYSGRLWFLPSSHLALQVSAGHLTQADFKVNGQRADVDRITGSATYHRTVVRRLWATTVALGRNREQDISTSAFLAETAFDLTERDVWFARGEVVDKTAADLALPGPQDTTFRVTKLQTGYMRWLPERGGVRPGVGAGIGVGIIPAALRASYGRRPPLELSVFLAVRPR